MTTSGNNPLSQTVSGLLSGSSNLWSSIRILNLIGYGFLIFWSFDVIATLTPPDFTNPEWELGFVGSIVERVAAPLLGFGLIFVGGLNNRLTGERLVLKLLSWLTFVIAILYFMIMALGVSSTYRIDRSNNQKLTTNAHRTKNQLQQIQQEFQSVTTIEQMETLLSRIDGQGRAPEIADETQYQDVKREFGEFLQKGQKRLPSKVKTARDAQRFALFKKSLKWNLGALLSAALFFTIGRSTADIRRG